MSAETQARLIDSFVDEAAGRADRRLEISPDAGTFQAKPGCRIPRRYRDVRGGAGEHRVGTTAFRRLRHANSLDRSLYEIEHDLGNWNHEARLEFHDRTLRPQRFACCNPSNNGKALSLYTMSLVLLQGCQSLRRVTGCHPPVATFRPAPIEPRNQRCQFAPFAAAVLRRTSV